MPDVAELARVAAGALAAAGSEVLFGVRGAGDPAEVMRDALGTAAAAPPGPVHLDLDPSAVRQSPRPPVQRAASDMAAVNALLAAARKPVVLVGVGARHEAAAIRSVLD